MTLAAGKSAGRPLSDFIDRHLDHVPRLLAQPLLDARVVMRLTLSGSAEG